MRNKQWSCGSGILGLVLGLALAGVAAGQAPPPPAPVPTVWDKLGVTGFNKCLQSKLCNPHGNHPGLEKKPLLKPIADPANLDPKMPKAVQAAAAIKQQEDLAPQKIKAIKYLATMGCSCYQKTVDVRGALLEALDDCTEDVRLAAAEALCEVAGNPCSNCGGTCCNAETMNKLQEHASGKDASGCFKEPSAEVRQMAQAALDACRRKLPPGAAEVAPVPSTLPIEGPKPILPPPTEHPLGVHEEPVPVTPGPHVAPPPAPQPLPNPSGEEKKPLEVPAEPPRSSAAPRKTLPMVIAEQLRQSPSPRQYSVQAQLPAQQFANEPGVAVAEGPAPQPMPAPHAALPMPVYQRPQPMELAAAPLPPPVVLPTPQRMPRTSYQPQPLTHAPCPLAILAAAAPAQPVAVPAAQSERSYVAIVDIKPVAYEARTTRRLPQPAETHTSEQPKVVLRLVIPAEK